MIYLENIREPQRVFLPNNGNYDGDEALVEFWLRNTIERRELRTDTGDNYVNGADGYLLAQASIVPTSEALPEIAGSEAVEPEAVAPAAVEPERAEFTQQQQQIVQDADERRVRVLGGRSSHYFAVEISLPAGLPNGEYEYCLQLSGSYALSKGLAVIGKIERVAEQAAHAGLEIKQAR